MYFLWWYIVLQVLGLVATPIAFACFHRCRDRGWAYAKAIGIIFPLHLTWLLAHAGLPYSFLLLGFGVLVTAFVSAVVLRSERLAMREWLRAEWRRLLVIEAVFLVAMVYFGMVRAYNPEIESRFRGYGSEKFMDIMFVNSVHQSRTFPPNDAWFAGKTINYYWYGYYVCSALSKLSGIPTQVGYNLALVTAFGLAAVMAFALVWHLSGRWWAGLCGAAGLTLLGNPQSFRLYVGWAAKQLGGAPYIWDSSRVINGGHTINEFPYFSFLWGDLHGHVTSLPFTVLVLACAACIWIGRNSPRRIWVLGPLVTALAYGVSVACNNWDLPAYAIVIVLTSLVYFPREVSLRGAVTWLESAAAQRVSAVVLGIILLLPFFLAFDAPKKSLNWGITSKTPMVEFLSMFGYQALIVGTYLCWLLLRSLRRDRRWFFVVIVVTLAVVLPLGYLISHRHTVRSEPATEFDPDKAFILSGFLLAGLVLVTREILRFVVPGFLETKSGSASPGAGSPQEPAEGHRFVALIVLLALLILLGTEYVAMSDFYGKANERMNTLFKFHFQVWTMLAVAGGWMLGLILGGRWEPFADRLGRWSRRLSICGWGGLVLLTVVVATYVLWVRGLPSGSEPTPSVWAYQAAAVAFLAGAAALAVIDRLRGLPANRFLARRLRSLWCFPWLVVASWCLTFTVRGTAIKTDRGQEEVRGRKAPTLDGRIWLEQEHPEDLAVIKWLLRSGSTSGPERDVPHIVEAVADESYSYLGRIAAFTGFPAVTGWPNHEGIWRSHHPEVEERKREARKIYTSNSLAETDRLLRKYQVDYVILGQLERETFGADFLMKKFPPYTVEAYASGRTSVRGGWNQPVGAIEGVTVEARPNRVDENPPVAQTALPVMATLGKQGTAPGELNEPRGMEIGSDGSIYVADSKNARIMVFGPDGTPGRGIPDPSETNPRARLSSEYSGPGDVALDREGNLLVVDTWGSPPSGGFGRVVKYDRQGRFVAEWASPQGLFGPRGIDVAPNGEVYVADTGNKRVQVFGPDGQFRFAWGREGEAPGDFIEPVGIAVTADRVYVCDTGNRRVQIFDLGGRWVGEFTPYGWGGNVVGIEPYIDVDAPGRLWVTDSTKGRLQVFSPQGDPILHCYLGLQRPTGIAVSGTVGVVAESSAHRVRVFTLP